MRQLLVIAAGAMLVAAGIGATFALDARRQEGGRLDTRFAGVSLESNTVAPANEPPTAPAPVEPDRGSGAESVERPCWLQFGGNAQRSLARPETHLGRPTSHVWARGLGGYIEFPATYCDGLLYVNTFRGVTFAIDAKTGRIVWRQRGANKPSSPAIAGRRLIVSANDGTVTAFQRFTGRRLWRLRVGSRVESSPAVAGGIVYFGAADGRLFAVYARTGRVRWAYDTGGTINSSPTVSGNRVCITTYAGSIFCLRRHDGWKQWRTYVRRDLLRFESFYASASTDGRRLYTIARSGKIVALSAASGRVLWTRNLHSLGYSTPAVAGGRIFVGGFDSALHAYHARTGLELWKRRVGGRILGAPVVIGRLVFFSTLERRTYAVRVSDGRVVWRIGMGKYSPTIATDRHYFMTLNGILVAFRGLHTPPD